VLAGRSFARLEMSRPQPVAANGGTKEAPPRARPSRYLEFSLVTTEAAKGAKIQ